MDTVSKLRCMSSPNQMSVAVPLDEYIYKEVAAWAESLHPGGSIDEVLEAAAVLLAMDGHMREYVGSAILKSIEQVGGV